MTTQEKKLKLLNGLKKLCAGAVIFGFVTSAGGNVLHAVEDSDGRSTVGKVVSIVIAVLIPTIFGWMFEIASRVFFRKEAALLMKLIAFAGAAGISGITAWNSYFHQRDAFSHFGDETQAFLLPLAIDGLMIIGSVYLIELGFQIRDMEAWIDAGNKPRRREDVPPPRKDKELTKRERIIQILASAPKLDAKALAAAAGTSYNYAYSVMKEMQKELEPETV